MSDVPDWLWNESLPPGTDYQSQDEVLAYDRRMAQIRDVDAENAAILDALQLSPDATLVEIGCGTGRLAMTAARRCRKVVAIDVSQAMLTYAADRAAEAGLSNVEFHHAGFLTYEHRAEPVDAVASSLCLHHLPDYWKSVALGRIACMLRPGGLFFLMDIVYSFQSDPAVFFPARIDSASGRMRQDIARHIRREYSTLDWIMRGLLERAGFSILTADPADGFLARYLCRLTRSAF